MSPRRPRPYFSPGQMQAKSDRQSSSILSPFETINQERINPSRVGAMQTVFEPGRPDGGFRQQPKTWRDSPRSPATSQASPFSMRGIGGGGLRRGEDADYDYAETVQMRTPLMQSKAANAFYQARTDHNHISPPSYTIRNASQPQMMTNPTTLPSPHTSSLRRGHQSPSTGSGNGFHNNFTTPRNSWMDNRPSDMRLNEDEDDGVYDNINVDIRHRSRGSEVDTSSLSSRKLPSQQNTNTFPSRERKSNSRIGNLLRRFGATGTNQRQPTSASSLMSLNRVSGEISAPPHQHHRIGLMKSNSLSMEPWKEHVIRNSRATVIPTEKRNGLGQRLRDSIFGSKKKLNH